MEIIDERNKGDNVQFHELEVGDTFEYKEDFFMKIPNVKVPNSRGEFYNAVRIDDGSLDEFPDLFMVKQVIVQMKVLRDV